MVPVPVRTLGKLESAALTFGGFVQIDAPDVTTAEAWAARLPATTAVVAEIRSVVSAPGM